MSEQQFTKHDRDKAKASVALRANPSALLVASGLDLTTKERAAVLARLGQMPESWRNLYLRAVGGSQAAAIKSQCGECLGWVRDEITACTALACPLYNVRPFQSR